MIRSQIRIRNEVKNWIRICIEVMRIHNPAIFHISRELESGSEIGKTPDTNPAKKCGL
jgi:hypothetical protein